MKRTKGFTLIELLVVVAIIGILATVVLASLGQARKRAQVAKTLSEIGQIKTMIAGAQINNNQYLGQITGSFGFVNDCTGGMSSMNCADGWESAIDLIAAAYDSSQDATSFYEDAWGSPYLLEANEQSGPGGCQVNTITSAGPDRGLGGVDNITVITPYAAC